MANRKIVISVMGSEGVDTTLVAAFITGCLRGHNVIAALESKDEERLVRLVGDDHTVSRALGAIAQSQQKPIEDQDQVLVVDGGLILQDSEQIGEDLDD